VTELFCLRRLSWQLLVLLLLAGPLLGGCRLFHPYRIPNPQGPVVKQKKVKKKDPNAAEMADGSTGDASAEPARMQKNSYDSNGLLKKPKMKHRRLKKKIGQRRFLGFTLPF
jgi:hypothetical protein